MTERYRYAPLAAAWMAKNYGMRFVNEGGLKVFVIWGIAQTFTFRCYENSQYCGDLYIHPDSYHILEPQFGDMIYDGDSNIWHAFGGENLNRKSLFQYETIIQRNRIAFIWPEKETVEEGVKG